MAKKQIGVVVSEDDFKKFDYIAKEEFLSTPTAMLRNVVKAINKANKENLNTIKITLKKPNIYGE